jgi:hypothetical protein
MQSLAGPIAGGQGDQAKAARRTSTLGRCPTSSRRAGAPAVRRAGPSAAQAAAMPGHGERSCSHRPKTAGHSRAILCLQRPHRLGATHGREVRVPCGKQSWEAHVRSVPQPTPFSPTILLHGCWQAGSRPRPWVLIAQSCASPSHLSCAASVASCAVRRCSREPIRRW